MSIRTIGVILLALMCGASAVAGITMLGAQRVTVAQPEVANVVVAKADIPRGQQVSASMLTVTPWPKDLVPQHAITNLKDAEDRAAVTPIVAGEPVLERKLASKDAGRGLAAMIPNGMRAYTIQTSRVGSNVAGLILPGNRVDVLLSLRGDRNDETGGGSSTTLLQAVEILAVDQAFDAPAENKMDVKSLRSVTLLVTPEQAVLLDLGQNMGTLTLTLRALPDTDEAEPGIATVKDLRYRQEPPVEPSPDAVVVRKVPIEEEDAEGAKEDTAAPEKKEPEIYEIRTLRGSHSGRVYVTARR